MALARVDEFKKILETLSTEDEIKELCLSELTYLRQKLGIKYQLNDTISDDLQTLLDLKHRQNIKEPIKVIGNTGHALKCQLTYYRNAIKLLQIDEKSDPNIYYTSYDRQGNTQYNHYALKYLKPNQIESEDSSQNAIKRQRKDAQNLLSFDPIEAINKAIELLDSNSYVDKVSGLYLLTGRRHEEILASLQIHDFDSNTIIDEKLESWLLEDMGEYSLVISGLVKGNDKTEPYSTEHELIPVLCNPELIKNTIDYLRQKHPQEKLIAYYNEHKIKKDNPSHNKPRPSGSKELGIRTKKHFKDILPSPSGKDGDLNPHNLRSAYVAILKALYDLSENKGQNLSYDEFIYSVIRHKAETTVSSQSYLDYELNSRDMSKLRDFLN